MNEKELLLIRPVVTLLVLFLFLNVGRCLSFYYKVRLNISRLFLIITCTLTSLATRVFKDYVSKKSLILCKCVRAGTHRYTLWETRSFCFLHFWLWIVNNFVHYFQSFYSNYVVEKFRKMDTWGNKLKAIFWGPSWEPGTPRLGDEDMKIDVSIPC